MERKGAVKRKPENISERDIIIGLITSTEYLQQIQEVWKNEYIESATAKRIAGWCWEYYNEYHEALGTNNFDRFYLAKLKKVKLSKEITDELEQEILPSLYKEHVQKGGNKLLLNQTHAYFRERHLTIFNDTFQALIAAGQIEEAEKLTKEFKPLDLAIVSKINPFIWTVDEMKLQDRKEPRMLMSPWLREGQLTFIYGEWETGKSLLAIHIAYLLGLKEFTNKECEIGEWQVKNPTGCLYIDGEMGASELKDRISKFEWIGKQQRSFKIMSFPLPEYQLATEDSFILSERQNQQQIVQWLKEHPSYKLLILDSVTTLFGLAEENSNSEWNTKINPFLRDLRALGVACILLHHAGKEGSKGLRGASSMGAMAHNIFYLTNHTDPPKDKDDGEAWFTLNKKKQRSGGFEFKKFSIHYYQDSAMSETGWEITDGATERKSDELSDNQIQIIKYKLRGMKQTVIMEKMNCSQSNVSQSITKAKKLGYLQQDNKPTSLWENLMDDYINCDEEGE